MDEKTKKMMETFEKLDPEAARRALEQGAEELDKTLDQLEKARVVTQDLLEMEFSL